MAQQRIVTRREDAADQAYSQAPPHPGEQTRRAPDADVPLEEREVAAADPAFSEETNARITEELQEAVGAGRVEVPVDRPHVSTGEHPDAASKLRVPTVSRVILFMSLGIILAIAAIAALGTGAWWLLPLAAAIHAAGTMAVVMVSVRMTRDVEHPSPTLAAAMTAEGAGNPDHVFSEMVEEYRSPQSDEMDVWHNQRTVSLQDDPATASAEQARSMTPTAQPSREAPTSENTVLVVFVLAAVFVVLSIIVPLVGGGNWLWLTPAVIVPLCVALVTGERLVASRDDVRNLALSTHGMAMLWSVTVLAVAIFCALVVLVVHH